MIGAPEYFAPVVDLARVVFMSSWRFSKLVMLAAYIDESGHPSSGTHLILGGLASTGEQWEALEVEWLRAKSDYDFPIGPGGKHVPFHATDFFGGHGDFTNYDVGRSAKQELYERLLRIMQRHVSTTAFTILLYSPWEQFVKGDAKRKKKVYTMCALGLASRLYRWANRHGEPLAYVFERAKKVGQGQALKAIEKLAEHDGDKFLIGPVIPAPKGIPSLDAADIWCHELKQYMNQVIATNDPTPNSALSRLIQIPQQCGYVFGEAELTSFLEFIVENRGTGRKVQEVPIQAISIPFKRG